MNQPLRVVPVPCCNMRRMAALMLTAGGIAGAVGVSTWGQQKGVEIAVLNAETWDRFAPEGKEVDAIYGDVVLRNEYLTAVIARPTSTRHANMTVRDVGGMLIDLTTREAQSDQLSAFYPARRRHPSGEWGVSIDGGAAVAVGEKTVLSGGKGEVRVQSPGGENRPECVTVYRLEAGSKFLTIASEWKNQTQKDQTIVLDDDLRLDHGREDVSKSPDGTHEAFWIHDRFWHQAYGLMSEGRKTRFSSEKGMVFTHVNEQDQGTVTLKPGESFTLSRKLYTAKDEPHLRGVIASDQGVPLVTGKFTAKDGLDRPIPGARIEFVGKTGSLGTVTVNERGEAEVPVPVGEYTVKLRAMGLELAEFVIPFSRDVNPITVSLGVGRFKPGTVVATIVDEGGGPIPCKVQFQAEGNAPVPNFGPDTGEFGVKNLRYTPDGRFRQDLVPGVYRVTVSRGPEYDAVTEELTVSPGQETKLMATLKRSVDTAGWISADFHSHSTPSGDNTSSQLGRVLNLVCEQVEYAPCTEHNRIDTYDEEIARLGVAKYIGTSTGMELTGKPLPLNHQNSFPLKRSPHTQDGGAPVTDESPESQIERISLWDERSDKLVQQNHPDIGWLFYDKDGDGKPDSGYERGFALMDVIEVHPVETILNPKPVTNWGGTEIPNTVFDWVRLLNQGYRIPGVVNTDAHYNFHGSGWLRNWLRSPTDDPSKVDTLDVVHAAEQGAMIISNGPFLDVSFHAPGSGDRRHPGEDLAAPGKKVVADVRVQCANWLDIDRVYVLVNGRVVPEWNFTREKNPEKFRSGVVKFKEAIELTLNSDAHLLVVAAGEHSKLGVPAGEPWSGIQPAAISNPVFVDMDGGGFKANKDTLDFPLPVKYVKSN